MDEKSTTVVDDSTADASTGTTTDETITTTDNKTAETGDNLDPSKSADTTVADDDKKSDTTTKTDDAPASKFDDDLDDWITKRGLKVPETDAEKQALQELRNDQREFTRERQAKKDAEDLAKAQAEAKPGDSDDDDEEDPLAKDVKDLKENLKQEKVTRLQSEFYTSNKITPEEHKMILDVMKEKFAAPTTPEGKKRAFELWSSTDALPDLLDLAKARLVAASKDVIADEAALEERERIARESNAKSPGRSATNTTTSDKTEDEARLERFKARYNKT